MRKSSSVARLYLLLLFLISMGASLVSGVFQMLQAGTQFEKEQAQSMEALMDGRTQALQEALWDLNTNQIKAILISLSSNPQVYHVKIDFRGRSLEAGETGIPQKPLVLVRDIKGVLRGNEVTLGTFTLTTDLMMVYKNLEANLWRSLLQALLAGLLLTLAIGSFYWFQVSRPLGRLTALIDNLTPQDLETPLKWPQTLKNEFLAIAHTLEFLRQKLSLAFIQRKQAEDKLRETMAAEERKNAEMENFTYTVSHDLKSPLVTIQGFAGFIKSDLVSGDNLRIFKDLDRIDNAVERMGFLLEGLLELSRVGRVVNPSQTFDPRGVVIEVLDLLEGRISQAGGRVILAPAPWPLITADLLRFRQVVQNLVENAFKYRLPDCPQEVRIRVDAGPGETVFAFEDRGVGIEAAQLERIFSMFTKLNPHSEGLGLGLSFVQRIIESHGGRIWAESPGLGRGATFYFTIPSTVQSP